MNECTFIMLGATGDLAKRKLIPALYKLIHDKKIDKLLLIGAALDDITVETFLQQGKEFIKSCDEKSWNFLVSHAYYQPLDFHDRNAFFALKETIEILEKKHGMQSNRLVYLATPSTFFCPITQALGFTEIIKRSNDRGMIGSSWQRIVYEKPFGVNRNSAQEINDCIMQWFNEHQIFRIDHYLTKELVSNIVLVRFTNMIFEPLWNKKYIKRVEITLHETIGIEGRGAYYDYYGVLKDVVQNHAMQLMALIGMELPKKLTAEDIRDQRANVLEHIKPKNGILGQYQGYKAEKNVRSHSTTPTFAFLEMYIDNDRWQNVPFIINAGKKLAKKDSSIHICFHQVECPLPKNCPYSSNCLTIQIEPNASFSLQINGKKPGLTYQTTPITLSFNHDYVFGTMSAEAYEVLFEQIIAGEQSISVRLDEIDAAWAILDKIEALKLPLYEYLPQSEGPEQIKNMIGTIE